MTFKKFAQLAESHGLTAVQCNKYHWQIRGGAYSTNYYANTGTVFVNGMTKGGKFCSPQDAMQIAQHGPTFQTVPAPRVGFSFRYKRQLLRRDNKCHWCRCTLVLATATFEHVIPLSKGGTNHGDNIRLACEPCNKAKGDRIGPPPTLAGVRK